MAYYSFEVVAEHPVSIVKPFILLDEGMNVFSAEVDDLSKFMDLLHDESVTVRKVNCLDDMLEENQPSDLLLPGESLSDVAGLLAPSGLAHKLKG